MHDDPGSPRRGTGHLRRAEWQMRDRLGRMGEGPGDLEREVERLRQRCDALTRELEEAQHYRRAVEGSPVPTMCVSGAKGRYVFVNEAFAKMLDLPLETVQASDP